MTIRTAFISLSSAILIGGALASSAAVAQRSTPVSVVNTPLSVTVEDSNAQPDSAEIVRSFYMSRFSSSPYVDVYTVPANCQFTLTRLFVGASARSYSIRSTTESKLFVNTSMSGSYDLAPGIPFASLEVLRVYDGGGSVDVVNLTLIGIESCPIS